MVVFISRNASKLIGASVVALLLLAACVAALSVAGVSTPMHPLYTVAAVVILAGLATGLVGGAVGVVVREVRVAALPLGREVEEVNRTAVTRIGYTRCVSPPRAVYLTPPEKHFLRTSEPSTR